MASYQEPQFLDAGDKIFLGLNIRQFGYALAGLFTSMIIYSFTLNIIPTLGIFAVIPCIPAIALFGYLAWGKYNGRDSEVYVLKFFLFNVKPRFMVFRREADMSDLNEKFGDQNEKALNQKWENRVKEKEAQDNNNFYNFNAQNSDTKAERIRNLGDTVDRSLVNTLSSVEQERYKIKNTERLIQQIQSSQKKNKGNIFQRTALPFGTTNSKGVGQNPLLETESFDTEDVQISSFTDENVDTQNDQNFFGDEK